MDENVHISLGGGDGGGSGKGLTTDRFNVLYT